MTSKTHPNRRAHNWLAYNSGDKLLERYSPVCKGVLYDLGAGESPYKESFLSHADAYAAVNWSGSLHDTHADIQANLDEPLPIEPEVADTVEPQAGFFTMMVLKWKYFTRRFLAGPRPLRMLLKALMCVFWFPGQALALLLDNLDRDWEREAPGYFVTVHKP